MAVLYKVARAVFRQGADASLKVVDTTFSLGGALFWGWKNALELSCKRLVYFIGTMILRSVVAFSVTIHCCFVMHENVEKSGA